jgi:hypothetical protein
VLGKNEGDGGDSEADSSRSWVDEKEGMEAELLVPIVRRGADCSDRASARWCARWFTERKKTRGKKVAAQGNEGGEARVSGG